MAHRNNDSWVLGQGEYSDLARGADNWRYAKEAFKRASDRIQPGRCDMMDDSDILQVMAQCFSSFHKMSADLKKAKAELSAAVEAAAIGEAVRAAINGEPLSDFMESYPDVRHAIETREYAQRYYEVYAQPRCNDEEEP